MWRDAERSGHVVMHGGGPILRDLAAGGINHLTGAETHTQTCSWRRVKKENGCLRGERGERVGAIGKIQVVGEWEI